MRCSGMGLLVAADARDKRVALLRRVLDAHGAGASLVEHDLHAGAPFGPVFDRVLVDAPCTGLGTLRRDVDIRWRRAPEDLVVAARRQGRMLAEASAAVAPGGRLVYATCSSEPEENEQVVSAFLADHAGFRRVPAQTLIDEGLAAALLNPDTGELVTRPDHHGLECFYAAAVERDATAYARLREAPGTPDAPAPHSARPHCTGTGTRHKSRVVHSTFRMVSTSRVWGAGKFLVLLAALGATFLVSAFVAVRVAVRAREVSVPDAGRAIGQRRVRAARRSGPHAARGRQPAPRSQGAGRAHPAAGPGAGHPRAARAVDSRLGQRRRGRHDRARSGRPDRTHRADAPAAGRPDAGRRRRDPIARLRRRSRRRAGAGAVGEGRPRRAAREPRRADVDAT